MTNTIAAVSTPHGKGGVAMIRISGPETRDILERVFEPAGKTAPADAPRTAVFGRILLRGQAVDTGICTFYKAPASYTGEDTAELTCHGGIAVTSKCLEAAFAAGASPAAPGEFTRRAFVSGKLTLSEAEAVGMLIDADTQERAALAASASQGKLSEALSRLADRITAPLSQLYAAIDYPDEEIGEISPAQLCASFRETAKEARALAATERRGRAVAEGVRCAVVGRPNGGKSSLYNLLCGEDRAIVTDIAGTTRDVLTETVSFAGITLLLADTAGLRESDDSVERIGVERARREAECAGLVFFVYDMSDTLTKEERDFAEDFRRRLPDTPTVAILNKTDLPRALSPQDEEFLSRVHTKLCTLSARTGDGLSSLESCVAGLFDSDIAGSFDSAVVWNSAQSASLESAADSLEQAATSLEGGMFPDAACTMAEDALSALLRIDGRGVSEEIVSSIFARFCVGK